MRKAIYVIGIFVVIAASSFETTAITWLIIRSLH